ncbi:MAG: hypothetical protein DMG14_29340, partial [Acidobacteria bacterium]
QLAGSLADTCCEAPLIGDDLPDQSACILPRQGGSGILRFLLPFFLQLAAGGGNVVAAVFPDEGGDVVVD